MRQYLRRNKFFHRQGAKDDFFRKIAETPIFLNLPACGAKDAKGCFLFRRTGGKNKFFAPTAS